VAAGKLHDRAALDRMLNAAAAAAKNPPPPPAATVTQTQPVYVMRHLHTPQGERDPDLTAEGRAPPSGSSSCSSASGRRDLRQQLQAHPADRRAAGCTPWLTPIVYDPADTPALIARVRAGPVRR
jgi:hypothetical protein